MKVKDLFINNSLIGYINSISPLNAEWLNSLDKPVINVTELDNYILMCLGDSNILKSVENHALNNIRTMLNANSYRLNNLWETTNFDYNPIDNYDRTETQTHNEKIETGAHTTTTNVGERTQTTNVGERTQTNSNGGFTDTTTIENKTTSFDSADYEKGTDKNSTNFVKGSSSDSIVSSSATDSIVSSSATDSVTQNGYTDNSSGGYTIRARGNIGTMSTQNMIEQQRKIVDFLFMDKIIELFEKYITCMCYE